MAVPHQTFHIAFVEKVRWALPPVTRDASCVNQASELRLVSTSPALTRLAALEWFLLGSWSGPISPMIPGLASATRNLTPG